MRTRAARAVAAVVVAIGLVGCTPTDGNGPTSTTTTTVPPDRRAERYFSPTVSWNRPVSELGITTSFAGYERRMFDYAGAAGWHDPALPIGFNPATRGQWLVAFRNYSVPIYDAADATTTRYVYWTHWAWPFAQSYVCDGVGVAPCPPGRDRIQTPPTLTDHTPARIPWNPAWKPGTGNDRLMAIVDHRTGETWELAGVDLDPEQCTENGDETESGNWGLNDLAVPRFVGAPDQMCLAGARRYPNIYETTTTVNSRGMGISKLALVTRAVEVESGAIRHALALANFNTMFGPVCTPNGPMTAGAGVSCGFSLTPATKVEHLSRPHSGGCGNHTIAATDANRSRTVPTGMRFRVDVTDAEITAWLDAKGLSGTLRNTARIFAVALRDYGFVAGAETGCNTPLIETDGLQNPETAAIWAKLGVVDGGDDWDGDGVTDYPTGNLLFGTRGANDGKSLITLDRLQIVNPGDP